MSVAVVIAIAFSTLYKFPYRPFTDYFTKRIELAKEIVTQSLNRPYNITDKKGRGMDPSSIKNYEYLTWWLGNEPYKKNEKLKFYMDENSCKIIEVEGIVK